MENQWLGVAGGVIFYVTWSMVYYDSIEEELMEIEIPFYSHPETHKDPIERMRKLPMDRDKKAKSRSEPTQTEPTSFQTKGSSTCWTSVQSKGRPLSNERFLFPHVKGIHIYS
ncbi:hypothetical protein TNCV_2465211 [Trichonephila clavipes]|uniref:Uncharacterized protein n=1 Tax=Trichonephila clavipes TaxID=2585209 RepID=A0A8X6UTZ9_TRICX|nr:hypothetical protein TNCV_2465211 [Trichonephila clavipes]